MPLSDCEVRDPRIRRTRQLLQAALRDLMQTRAFDEISVQDITETATLNRATFYDHYTDKFSLLAALVGGGFHQLLHERNITFDGTCPSAARAIILATCDYLAQTHASPTDCNRNRPFEPLMESAITTAIQRVILQGITTRHTQPPLSPELIATTASWAIYGAVKQWFYTPNRPQVADIIDPILELILPLLITTAQPATPMAHSA
jgi:AcrR family transcriptional regulator